MDNILPTFKSFSILDDKKQARNWYPEAAAPKAVDMPTPLQSSPNYSYEREILPPNERHIEEIDDPKPSPLGECERYEIACLF
jgi:hypothetical protein